MKVCFSVFIQFVKFGLVDGNKLINLITLYFQHINSSGLSDIAPFVKLSTATILHLYKFYFNTTEPVCLLFVQFSDFQFYFQS